MINALISSGLNTKEFAFYGFLPLNKKNRKNILERIKNEDKTIILYEAPHKLIKTLEDILESVGNVNCVIAKELTKIHEKFERNNIYNLIEKLNKEEKIKGEYIILLDMNFNQREEKEEILNKSIKEQYEFYKSQGMEKKDIIKQIAKNKNVPKNEIYKLFV